MNLYKHGDVIEIIERDASSQKVGSWKFNTMDTKLANRILGSLIKKYNLAPDTKQVDETQTEKKNPFLDLNVDW